MIDLDDVTLLAADTANHALALRALRVSMESIRFGRVVLLTDAIAPGVEVPQGIDVVAIEPIASRAAYSQLMLKTLVPQVMTSHVLVVQWDGYVINPEAWEPRFADCDYLGAKWFWHEKGMNVGNGGFSLRSRKLLVALADPRIAGDGPEDETICRNFRPLLEAEYGIRFGDEAMADRFAFEAMHPVGKPFGFHGLFNFARVMPAAELAALAPLFSDAIARSPQCLQLLRNAKALAQWAAAGALATRMLAANPDDTEVLAAQAEARRRDRPYAGVGRNDRCPCGSGKRYKQCHGSEQSATPQPTARQTLHAADAEALVQRAILAHRQGDVAAAERDYRAAIALDADAAYALHYLGVIHYQHGRYDDARALIARSLALRPQEAEFHNNAGLLDTATDRIDAAIGAFDATLARRPDHCAAWNNLGLAHTQRNDLAAAVDAYQHAIALAPDFAAARWNLALAELARGNYAAGWRDYDARLAIPALSGTAAPVTGTRYRGGALQGRRLLLTAEQGLGDALQFIRFAQNFAARGALVIAQVPMALQRLCANAAGVTASVAVTDPLPPFDVHLPLMSSAAVLAIEPAAVTTAVPYLFAEAARIAHWQEVVDARPERLKVGLSWAGNPRHVNDRRRSCPLSMLAPLLELDGVSWYSLQHIDGEDQIAGLPAAQALQLTDARHNFDDKAALMQALDLVISVDTSTAHLAGALGLPLWVLLPFAADWRWGIAGDTTPWYPQARLFRQSSMLDWHEVIARMRMVLATKMRG